MQKVRTQTIRNAMILMVAVAWFGWSPISAMAQESSETTSEDTGEQLQRLVEALEDVQLDRGKALIEAPAHLVAETVPVKAHDESIATLPDLDLGKMAIELPVESLVLTEPARRTALNETPHDEASRAGQNENSPDNPECQPGLVSWHSDFQMACQASEKSGKPVLLFQLLGNLDERFT